MNKEDLHKLIADKQPNICQIVAYKDNEKVYSDTWNDYKESDCVHIMSATKSIMALLIGIAIDKGLINSVDDKVLDYFPDYKVKRGEKTIYDVTIKHLLTMRAARIAAVIANKSIRSNLKSRCGNYYDRHKCCDFNGKLFEIKLKSRLLCLSFINRLLLWYLFTD